MSNPLAMPAYKANTTINGSNFMNGKMDIHEDQVTFLGSHGL